jgi:hypothetical protein
MVWYNINMAKDNKYNTKDMKPESIDSVEIIRKKKFSFPSLGVVVEATTLEEAHKLAIELTSQKN